MKTFIRPTFNRILVKRSEMKDAEGNIIIPDGAKERPNEGVIVALGPGVRTLAGAQRAHEEYEVFRHEQALDKGKNFVPRPFSAETDEQFFALGDKVTFAAYAGKPMKANGEEFTLLQQEELESVWVEVEDGQ